MRGQPDYWYVLRSKPRKEDALYEFVKLKGFEAYYPKLRVDPVNPRARRVVPFFPGYMFIKAEMDKANLSAFRWMPNSQGLVRFGGAPGRVPASFVNGIQHRLDELEGIGGSAEFMKGEQLRIIDGHFEGLEALFESRLQGHDRVRVLLKLLNGQWAKTELDISAIEKVD